MYLCLGGNLGDVPGAFAEANLLLAGSEGCECTRKSRLYRSAPWGDPDQPDFYNQVVELTWCGAFEELTRLMDEIEQKLGRTRDKTRRWGPRTLDIDILLYGDTAVDQDGFVVPHRELRNRLFALIPLAELAPDIVPPGWNLSVKDAIQATTDTGSVNVVE